MPKRVVIDTASGEVLSELEPGDRILRQRSVDYLQSTVEVGKAEIYTKIYSKSAKALAKEVTPAEMGVLCMVLNYLSYDTGILMFSNGRALTRSHIAKETRLSERQVDRIMEKLKELEVLKKVLGAKREVTFIMNPWLFMRGTRINKTLYEMFRNSKWAKVLEIKGGK